LVLVEQVQLVVLVPERLAAIRFCQRSHQTVVAAEPKVKQQAVGLQVGPAAAVERQQAQQEQQTKVTPEDTEVSAATRPAVAAAVLVQLVLTLQRQQVATVEAA